MTKMGIGAMKTTAILTLTVLALAGCTDTTRHEFNTREIGAELDTGYFGNATFQNTQVQTGAAGNARINLNNRFSNEVNTMVTFPFNSTVLDDTARATLRQQATWIRQFPEVRFKVFGHTDRVGSTAYNRGLGQRRAETVVQFLTSQGIDRNRLEAVVSFGETRPVVNTGSRERRNRRTVTEVSGFVTGNGAPLNGKYAEIIFREYVTSAQPDRGVTASNVGDVAQ